MRQFSEIIPLYDKSWAELDALMDDWGLSLAEGRVHGFALSNLFTRGDFWRGDPDFPFQIFFDNNPALHYQEHYGVRVLPPAAIAENPGRILVFGLAYLEIRDQLEKMGLVEYRDFMRAVDFLPLWKWRRRRRVEIQALTVIPTLRCTLNCDQCNMFLPKNPRPADWPLERLKADLDRMMEFVDRLQLLSVFGGEALLHPDLAAFLDYAGERLGGPLGEILLVINGTLAPDPELARVLKERRVYVSVTDYQLGDYKNYEKHLARTLAVLEEYGIEHRVSSFPWSRRYAEGEGLPEAELVSHYRRCLANVRCCGFLDGKLYPCLLSWAGNESGWVQDGPDDYLDAAELDPQRPEDREKFILAYLGQHPRGYMDICRHCYGNDFHRAGLVEAGRQLPRLKA